MHDWSVLPLTIGPGLGVQLGVGILLRIFSDSAHRKIQLSSSQCHCPIPYEVQIQPKFESAGAVCATLSPHARLV
jgi:hypothetical protein